MHLAAVEGRNECNVGGESAFRENHLAHWSFLLLPDCQLCSRHVPSKWNGTSYPWNGTLTARAHSGTPLSRNPSCFMGHCNRVCAASVQEQLMSGQGSWLEIGWAPTQTKHKRAWALAGTHDQRIACQHHGSESWTVVSKSRLHRTGLLGVPSCGSLQISSTEVLDCPVQLGRTWV